MRLYSLFNGMDYIGDFDINSIIKITHCKRSTIYSAIRTGYTVDGKWNIDPAEDRTLKRDLDRSLLHEFDRITFAIRKQVNV